MSAIRIDGDRLVEWASRAIGTPSFTGSEEAMAELMAETFAGMGLRVQWQQVEDGRANVLGTREGTGGGPSAHVQRAHGHVVLGPGAVARARARLPAERVRRGRTAVRARDLEHEGRARLLRRGVARARGSGRPAAGDVMVAAVCGEIEKTQHGEAQGAEYRGYATGTRHLVSHGGVADMCILGEPTESKLVLGHFGSLWLRISTTGPFVHTAFTEGKRDENSILRMRDVLEAVVEWIPSGRTTPRTPTAARRRSSTSGRSRADSAGG